MCEKWNVQAGLGPVAVWAPAKVWFLAGMALLAISCWSDKSYADDLVLWNRLDNRAEVMKSARGPHLRFYCDGTWPDGQGNPAYVPGVFGNALTIGPGNYSSMLREHTVVFDRLNEYLKPDRGTIEVWYKQDESPVPWKNAVYRILDGAYGLGSGMAFDVEWSLEDSKPWLVFGLDFGGESTTVKTDIERWNGKWIHLAGVWDRAGIGGSKDKLQLYVNGEVYAASTSAAWGQTVGPQADICGGNDGEIAGKFYLDNLKVYDYALTDFSHRFQEEWTPKPGAPRAPRHRAGPRSKITITINVDGTATEVVIKAPKAAGKVLTSTAPADDPAGGTPRQRSRRPSHVEKPN